MRRMPRRRTATPPTTPPAIAPTGVEDLEEVEPSAMAEEDEVDEGSTVVVWKTVVGRGVVVVVEVEVVEGVVVVVVLLHYP